jgi:glycosyltransferase involved in cell wall biosynthesis
MSLMPTVSVVMGVYNGADGLDATLASVLAQRDVALELIVVDDGSTDATGAILAALAMQDPRVRVLHQANSGLTSALIAGCRLARGAFIARQDAGDVSTPDRLRKQLTRMAASGGAVMCSGFVEFVGPNEEALFSSAVDEADAIGAGGRERRGPSHHGVVLMRRDAYEAVGGYREAFYFAQDRDLWSRLVEAGRHVVVPEVLYRARLEPGSLSGRYAREQRQLGKLIRQAAAARRAGRDEAQFLRAAARVKPWRRGDTRRGYAKGAYFIGSCLQGRDPAAARQYFREAVASDPLHLRAWLRLAGLGAR